MTKKEIATTILSKINLKYAKDWYLSPEQVLEFDYGFNADHLGLSMSEDEDLFDYALKVFETRCQIFIETSMREEVEKLMAKA